MWKNFCLNNRSLWTFYGSYLRQFRPILCCWWTLVSEIVSPRFWCLIHKFRPHFVFRMYHNPADLMRIVSLELQARARPVWCFRLCWRPVCMGIVPVRFGPDCSRLIAPFYQKKYRFYPYTRVYITVVRVAPLWNLRSSDQIWYIDQILGLSFNFSTELMNFFQITCFF